MKNAILTVIPTVIPTVISIADVRAVDAGNGDTFAAFQDEGDEVMITIGDHTNPYKDLMTIVVRCNDGWHYNSPRGGLVERPEYLLALEFINP